MNKSYSNKPHKNNKPVKDFFEQQLTHAQELPAGVADISDRNWDSINKETYIWREKKRNQF